MFGIGGWELLVIAVVALVVLGPKGLPSAARAIGRAVSELRRATTDLRQSIELDPELRDIPRALDELNRPLIAPRSPYSRRPLPKDGPPEDLPPPPLHRAARADLEEPREGKALFSDAPPPPADAPPASEAASSDEGPPSTVTSSSATEPSEGAGRREGGS